MLLIVDLISFYFTANAPGAQDVRFYSRFVLSGINFSEDESPEIKKKTSRLYKSREDGSTG